MLLLRCATPYEADDIIREIHEGICRNHAADNHYHSKHLDKGTTGQL